MLFGKSPLPLWVPFVAPAIAALYLAMHWEEVPAMWISHWGPGGVPNGWTHKSIAGAFAPLLFSLPLILVFEVISALLERRKASRPEITPIVDASRSLLRLLLTAVLALLSLVVAALPLGRLDGRLLAVGAAASLVLVLIAGVVPIVRATREVARSHGLEGYGGVVYRNPKDARLWVPKIMGLGWTLNFAHPLAWPVLLGCILGPLLVAGAILWLSAR